MDKACTKAIEIAPSARRATMPRRGMHAASGENDGVTAMRATYRGHGQAAGPVCSLAPTRGTAKGGATCGRGPNADYQDGLVGGGNSCGAVEVGPLGEVVVFSCASRIFLLVTATDGRPLLGHSIASEAPI